MRVALYARVSSEEQVRHGLSIEAQLAALDEWAKDKTVIDHYVDLGISARKPASKRPELQRLLRDVEAGKIDLIAFCKLDRWFRSVKEYYKVDEILEKHHVAWKAINEDYETQTASGRFKVNIMLAVAQDEADRTGERIKSVFAHKRERGETLNASAPFGTSIVNKHLTPNEDADKVKALYAAYIATRSIRQTAVNSEAYTGQRFTYEAVRVMLSNENYVKAGVIDRPTFSRVQELRQERGSRATNTPGRVYLFSGLVICPVCGHRMGAHTLKNGKAYYRCPQAEHGVCDNGAYVREDRIEDFLLSNILPAVEHERLRITKKSRPVDTGGIKRKMDKLTDLYMDDLITKEKYELEYRALQKRLNAAEATKRPPVVKEYTTVMGVYGGLSQTAKRAFWATALDRVECRDAVPQSLTLRG